MNWETFKNIGTIDCASRDEIKKMLKAAREENNSLSFNKLVTDLKNELDLAQLKIRLLILELDSLDFKKHSD